MILAACVQTRTELDTIRHLRSEGFQAWTPCETMERIIMGRKTKFRRPAVPGYVFIEVIDRDEAATIRKEVPAVYAFVQSLSPSGERRPASVPPQGLQAVFLAELLGDLDYTRQPDQWKPARGERVRVKASVWRGYIGKVLSLTKREAWIEPEKGGKLKVRIEELERAA